MQKSRQEKSQEKLTLVAAAMLVLTLLPETAALAQGYQAAEPKLDSLPSAAPEGEKLKGARLQGGIQKSDKKGNKTMRIMGGAKRAQPDTLRARAANDSALQAQAQ